MSVCALFVSSSAWSFFLFGPVSFLFGLIFLFLLADFFFRARRVKILQTDRGREYLSDMFNEFCKEKGIQRQLMIPRTSQQNGVAKCRNRAFLDMVRSMMAHANLPISFLGDALLTAAYIPNRVPSKSVTATPYELWHGRKLSLDHLSPWGSASYVHNQTHKYLWPYILL